LDNGEHAAEVAAMAEEARAGGISVTPSFVLNGEVRRWQGWEELKGAIDAALGATS
jgi:protein-disulfide isomerase